MVSRTEERRQIEKFRLVFKRKVQIVGTDSDLPKNYFFFEDITDSHSTKLHDLHFLPLDSHSLHR
jgi:hypothetical protein